MMNQISVPLMTLDTFCLLPAEVTCENERLCNLSHCFPSGNIELPHQPCLSEVYVFWEIYILFEEVFAIQQ